MNNSSINDSGDIQASDTDKHEEPVGLEFLAIGDTVIDAFIKLKQAHEVKTAGKEPELCMPFADKIPYEMSEELPAVGNSANGAVSATRLGMKSGIITNLGDDQHGKECLDRFHLENIDTSLITIHQGLKTNYHYVLWFEKDRTILIKHEIYPYKLPSVLTPKWLYLSSLGENSLDYHKEISEYLKANPSINLIFQPGTYQIKFGKEILAEIYKRSKIFVCNIEEAQHILGITDSRDVKILMEKISNLGPEIVVLTDGPDGAYARYKRNNPESEQGSNQSQNFVSVFIPAYPDPLPAYERTGAGDAFCSTFSVAIALGKTKEEAMKWGSINAAYVVQQVGAQKGLLSRDRVEKIMSEAPSDWQVKEI